MTNDITTSEAKEKLDQIGIEEISNLVSNGVRLRTHGNALNTGLLNEMDVSQQEFNSWLATQTPENQIMFQNAAGLGAKGVATDLVYRSIDVIDEIDLILSKMKRGATKPMRDKLEFLKAKHGAATDTLRQLVALQKAMDNGKAEEPQSIAPVSAQPTAEVVTTQAQRDQMAEMRRSRDE